MDLQVRPYSKESLRAHEGWSLETFRFQTYQSIRTESSRNSHTCEFHWSSSDHIHSIIYVIGGLQRLAQVKSLQAFIGAPF